MTDSASTAVSLGASDGVSLLHRKIHEYVKGEPLHVLLLGRNDDTEMLAESIAQAGYRAKIVDSISHLLAREEANTFSVIINLDVISEKQHQWLIDLADSHKQWPVIALSSEDNLDIRAAAVRMGGQSFFTSPFDTHAIVTELNALSERFERDPYQVLVIDDQRSVADYYSSVLREAGFITETITSPMTDLMPYLQHHIPDLILLDLYMPEISGQELAGIIRQMSNLISVPIVFLSCEMSPEHQLRALCTGADTFLTKPVKSADLLAAVESRIRRGRTVRNLVTRDPLTGLLNRRETLRRLEEGMDRFQRYGHALSLVMLDLDHFKAINDNHGHAVGDSVLKHFSMALQSVLRDDDIICRWGGEEFVLVLNETGPGTATKIVQRVSAFLLNSSPFEDFKYTFSAGIVSTAAGMNSENMLDIADRRLYQAKAQGRNCVVSRDD
ncbi:diguanylate cyclase [Bacterioplanoides sp.]|uniref:sensor domain-containing diguanylate cyclase n=1 Tax=Bacterioplanoides sp. TaxID=2066072 RepID=UPI003AFFAB3B